MPSTVYFAPRRAESHEQSLPHKVRALFDRAGGGDIVEKNALVAVKLHFGEKGGTAYIHPVLVRQVVDKIKEAGGKPFLCDTNTLYLGTRSNAVDHLQTALENGFSYATAGAPLIIADGLRGRNYREVPVKGRHFESVRIASEIVEADALVVLSHVKGHMLTGFGGALKNLGMGCGNRAGKQKMHSTVKPQVSKSKCRACGRCVSWCPEGAISLPKKGRAQIDPGRCVGCAECLVSCRHGAVKIQWTSAVKDMAERMIEYAAGAMKGKERRCLFVNFLLNIVPDCDCCGWSDAPIVADIGLLASTDPVAVDQASLDMVNAREGLRSSALTRSFKPGEDKFKAVHPESSYEDKLAYAAELGLGSREYQLVTVSK